MSDSPIGPEGRHLSPDELAKAIARKLAATEPPRGNKSQLKPVLWAGAPATRRMVSWTAVVGFCFGAGIGIASLVVWLTGGLPGVASDEVLGVVVTTQPAPPPSSTAGGPSTTVPETTTSSLAAVASSSTTTVPETTTTAGAPDTTAARPSTTTTSTAPTTSTTIPSTTTTSTIPTTTTTITFGPDTVHPTVTVTVPGPTSHTILRVGEPAFLTFSCNDPGPGASGIESCVATVNGTERESGWPIPTFFPIDGNRTVVVTARDFAGNETRVIRTYTVLGS